MRAKSIRIIIATLILLLGKQKANCQGAFQNLNFESANVIDVPSNSVGADVTLADGMPGWTAYTGSFQLSQIGHNNVSGGGAYIAIEGPQSPSGQILEGNYTAYVQGSLAGTPESAYIAQTGQIPLNSESLRFYANHSVFAAFQVTFDSQPISVEQIGVGPNYYIMGGDISAYAGQTGELRFTALPDTGGFLDNIQFSVASVPEPAALALFATVAGLLGLRCRRNPRP